MRTEQQIRQSRRAQNRRAYENRKKRVKGEDERKEVLNVRIRTSILGRIRRMIMEGIATGKYKYRTMSEGVEDLLIRGFGTFRGEDDMVDELWPFLDAAQQLDRVAAIRREAMVLLARAKQEIGEMLGIGGTENDAATYYHSTMENIHKMPPTVWRTWLINEMEKAFPDLAKMEPRRVSMQVPEPYKPALVRVKVAKGRKERAS